MTHIIKTKTNLLLCEIIRLTQNDESLLSSGESHIDLMRVCDEPHVHLDPTNGWPVINLMVWQGSHCAEDYVVPFST